MWSLMHNWRVFANQVRWNLRMQQVWSVSQLFFQSFRMCSKSTSRLVICNQARHYMIVDKILQVIKEKWWFYVDDKDEDWPDLIMFEKWLSRTAFLHEGFSAFKGERREYDQRGTNRDKRFSSVLFRMWKKPSNCKVITGRELMALLFKLIFNKSQNNKKLSAKQNKWILLKLLK